MVCSIEGCEDVARGHGYCSKHYTRWRRYGDPLYRARRYHKGRTPEKRFWAYVKKGAGPNACWEWTGGKMSTGYGMFHPLPRQSILAHRYAYELHHGPIAKGCFVCHHCDNRSCVNPKHLFGGSQQDNVDDMIEKGRDNWRGMPGIHNPAAKLTEASVRKIRSTAKTVRAKTAAIQHGVSVQLINAIRQRRLWAHIE